MEAVLNPTRGASSARAPEIRFIGRIGGRYTLHTRSDAGQPAVFACRTQAVSLREVVIAAPVNGEVGDPVGANFDDIGMVHGTISRQFQDGFAFAINPGEINLGSLHQRIEWVKRRRVLGIPDRRDNRRVIPRIAQTIIIMPDGKFSRGFVIDMSSSGAAISCEDVPEEGTHLSIGSVIGRVARQFEGGFAIKFLLSQDLMKLEDRMTSFNTDWAEKFHSLTQARSLQDAGLGDAGELDAPDDTFML